MSGYCGIGLCFESIKEEPVDLSSSGSNPFLDDLSNGNDQLKALAIVSKRPDSGSSSRSSISLSENVFSSNNQGEIPSQNDAFRPGNNMPLLLQQMLI